VGLGTGEGFTVAGRTFPFWLPLRFALPLPFTAGLFAFKLVALFALLVFAFLLADSLVFSFPFSLAFLLTFLGRLGLFSFAEAVSFAFWVEGFSSGVGVST
jgi:hypothetical protein